MRHVVPVSLSPQKSDRTILEVQWACASGTIIFIISVNDGKGGDCGRSGSEEIMNRKAITIWACGAVFCVSLFVAITPLSSGGGHSAYKFPPKVIATLIIGWDLIIAICFFLVKCTKKRRSR
jgi:hypothetical protein